MTETDVSYSTISFYRIRTSYGTKYLTLKWSPNYTCHSPWIQKVYNILSYLEIVVCMYIIILKI